MSFKEVLGKDILKTIITFENDVKSIVERYTEGGRTEDGKWFCEVVIKDNWFKSIADEYRALSAQKESIFVYVGTVWETIVLLNNIILAEENKITSHPRVSKVQDMYDRLVDIYIKFVKNLLKILEDIYNDKEFVNYHNYVNSVDGTIKRYSIGHGNGVSTDKKSEKSTVLKINLNEVNDWYIYRDDESFLCLKPIIEKNDFKAYNKNVLWGMLLAMFYFAGDDAIDNFLEERAEKILERIKWCDDYFRKKELAGREGEYEPRSDDGLALCDRLTIVFDFLKCFRDDMTIGEVRRNLFGEQ